jgi:hypothetical protein
VLLISWAIGSLLWSVNIEGATIGLVLKFVMVVVIPFVYFNLFKNVNRLQYGAISYLSICSVLSVLTLNRYVQASGTAYRPAAFGLNPNQTVFYIVLSLPLAVWVISSLSNHSVIHDLAVLLYFFVAGSSLLVLGSRGAIVASIPSFLLLWYVFYKSSALLTGSQNVAYVFILVSTVLVIAGIYAASTVLSGTYILPRTESIFTEVRTGEFLSRSEYLKPA